MAMEGEGGRFLIINSNYIQAGLPTESDTYQAKEQGGRGDWGAAG